MYFWNLTLYIFVHFYIPFFVHSYFIINIRELDKEYGLGDNLKNVLEIREWCKKKYGEKKIWERSLPSQAAKDEYEKSLGNKLSKIRAKIKKYEGKSIKKIENEEDRKIVRIIRC